MRRTRCRYCDADYPGYYFPGYWLGLRRQRTSRLKPTAGRDTRLCVECHTGQFADVQSLRKYLAYLERRAALATESNPPDLVASADVLTIAGAEADVRHLLRAEMTATRPAARGRRMATGIRISKGGELPLLPEDEASLLQEVRYFHSTGALHPRASDGQKAPPAAPLGAHHGATDLHQRTHAFDLKTG